MDDIVPGGEVEQSTVQLITAYFDTADRDLQAHGLLLRRRHGDDDTGWQLKVPDANGRIEIHYPLSDTMPPELSALITGVSLGKQLVNVATIHTTRKRYRITDPKSHQLVAEIADDHLCATVDGPTGERPSTRTQRRAADQPSGARGRELKWSGRACSSDSFNTTQHELLLGADLVVVAVDRFSAEAGDAPVAVSAHRSSWRRRLYVFEQVGIGDESPRR